MSKQRSKIEFKGTDGFKIAGLLETPDSTPKAFALFAHCFTCSKDIVAASRIARALVGKGYAVLRFDFTGLGNSEGDFANSNFSSNTQDLVLAADYLREHFMAPSLVIGHSLGGAAVLAAAKHIPEAAGIVTIGAPSDPAHVAKQFVCDIDTINAKGEAEVSLGGRPFTIKKQFLDDLALHDQEKNISQLNKALLVFHSPLDQTVSINEAEKIYRQAKHPKSFVSLDSADHLLSKAKDSEYVATIVSAWASRFIDDVASNKLHQASVAKGHIQVKEKNKQFTRTVISDNHIWLADEPVQVGGTDLGPDPYEHLLAALGICTSMTIRMYANRKKIPLEDVSIELKHNREHIRDCEECDQEDSVSKGKQIDVLEKVVQFKGDLSADQKQRLMEIADRCPVHQTLHNNMEIRTTLAE